jgi:phosphatidylglycerophosphate synthase
MINKPTLREIREAHSWKRVYEKYLPISRFLFRPLGFLLTWLSVRIGLTSEAVSWISGAVGLAGCYCLVSGDAELLSIGLGLLLLFNLLDCVDGSIARTMNTENPYGKFLDSICGGIIDLIFWCIIGVAAFRHPNLTFWQDPFGYGPLFWLVLGFTTSYLNIFHGYMERTFDELLRKYWEQSHGGGNEISVTASRADRIDTSTNSRTKKILRMINNNLRVRETHYILVLFTYIINAIDIPILLYFFYYVSQNVVLLILYSYRGRIAKKRQAP